MTRLTRISAEFRYATSGRLSRSMEEIDGVFNMQHYEFVAQLVIHTSSDVLRCYRNNANCYLDFFAAFGRRCNSVLGRIFFTWKKLIIRTRVMILLKKKTLKSTLIPTLMKFQTKNKWNHWKVLVVLKAGTKF